MPSAHFTRTTIKAGDHRGRSAAKVTYVAREGRWRPAQERDQYVRDEGRDDLVHVETHGVPRWAKDMQAFLAEAERQEGVGRVVCVEWKFDLPRPATPATQLAFAREVATSLGLGDNHAFTLAVHSPRAADGAAHPHAHIVWSARETDGPERPPEKFFRRPEAGGARKTPALNQFGMAGIERQTYCDLWNTYADAYGWDHYLHADKREARGFGPAEPKLLPSDSQAYRKGVVTKRMQHVLDHRARAEQERPAEMQQAKGAWQERKQVLGITSDMRHVQAIERVRQARAHAVAHKPPRQSTQALARKAQVLTQSISSAELEIATLRLEGTLERTTQVKQQPQAKKGHDLTGQLARLTARLAPTKAQAGSLPIRLHERDRDDEHGLGF